MYGVWEMGMFNCVDKKMLILQTHMTLQHDNDNEPRNYFVKLV